MNWLHPLRTCWRMRFGFESHLVGCILRRRRGGGGGGFLWLGREESSPRTSKKPIQNDALSHRTVFRSFLVQFLKQRHAHLIPTLAYLNYHDILHLSSMPYSQKTPLFSSK